MKRILILPIYNESSTLKDVLDEVYKQVDLIMMVNDGSTDRSGEIASSWAKGRESVEFTDLDENRGKAYALEVCFTKILDKLKQGEVDRRSLVIITDADGQLPLEIIDDACEYFSERKLDLLIGARDFSKYPLIKRVGNFVLSFLAAVLTGVHFKDTQCGFRILSVEALEKIVPYYQARGYSCEQEISIIAALLNLQIDNGFEVHPVYYRSNSTFADAFQIIMDSFLTRARVLRGEREIARQRKKIVNSGQT